MARLAVLGGQAVALGDGQSAGLKKPMSGQRRPNTSPRRSPIRKASEMPMKRDHAVGQLRRRARCSASTRRREASSVDRYSVEKLTAWRFDTARRTAGQSP